MRPKLNGNILFAFSDPGGAKPCLSLIEEDHLSNAIAVSDRHYSFYNDFKTHVKIVNQDFDKLIDNICPELIFTGTSYTSDIERKIIKYAKDKKILCYSFVDHWTSISKRFEDKNGNRTLPDKVWVIDERAKQLAIDQGISNIRLVISGNPYHGWLKKWKPKVNKKTYLKQLKINNKNQKILVYAPDPLSNIEGKDLYGFDELLVTTLLVELTKKHQTELKELKVLVKAHPNQDRVKLFKIIKDCKNFYLLPETVDTNTTLYYANSVMGFFSSLLIEASIMSKPILRFIDEHTKIDPIAELNLGPVINEKTLLANLLKI